MRVLERFFDQVCVLELSGRTDLRGTMTVSYSRQDLQGLPADVAIREQRVYSIPAAGTFFGIHYQKGNSPLVRIVSVIQGAGLDYIIDLRRDSATYRQWRAVELTGETPKAVLVPAGFGHAFLSTRDQTIQLFGMSGSFECGHAGKINWRDPEIGLKLPMEQIILSDADRNAPMLSEL